MDIKQMSLNIKCPNCKTQNTITLDQAQKQEKIVCAGCGEQIQMIDKKRSVAKAVQDANNSLENFKDKIKKIGKIEIKL